MKHTFNEYQDAVWDLALPQCRDTTYAALGLGEAGEVQGKIKKVLRGDKSWPEQIEAIKSELGDLQYYIALTAATLGLSLQDIADSNILKLRDRRQRGVIQGDGDTR
jgi:NTP pyrophosphatase (non-canonical NTP hydrolase)